MSLQRLSVAAEVQLPPPLERPKPLHYAHLAAPFDAYLGTLPEAAAAIPSMMSIGEREFLYGIAKNYYTGAGLIVDAGTFLGASTMCLGFGVKDNPKYLEIKDAWSRPINSYELGVTNSQMPLSFKRHNVGQELKAGDSFAPIVEAHISPVADIVNMNFGDIIELGKIEEKSPQKRTSIEILFLDVLKSEELSEFCLTEYFPRLIPRRSLVIQQDYINGDLPFIHIHQEFFADKFEYVGEISSSAVFRLVRRITRQEVMEFFASTLNAETMLMLGAKAAQRTIDNHRRVIMAFSKLRLLMRARGLEAGQQYWKFVESEYADQIAQTQFRRVQNVVRAARYLCEVGISDKNEQEAVKISTGHRGMDHRRTDTVAKSASQR